MELRYYLSIIMRRLWIIVVTLLVTMAVVIAGTLLTTPVYSASAVIRIATASANSVSYTDYYSADRLMNTYVMIATSAPVLDELKQTLNIQELPQIKVEIIPNTELIRITIESTHPILARDIANQMSAILISQSAALYSGGGKSSVEILNEQLNQLNTELANARSDYESLLINSPGDTEQITALNQSINLKEQMYASVLEQYEQARVNEAIHENIVSVLDPASTPLVPSKPNKLLNIALGLVVGLAGGFGLALLFENLDTTLYTTEQIEAATHLPIWGEIPIIKNMTKNLVLDSSSAQIDAFHRLRTKILRANQDGSIKVLMVTSAEPGEGKSMVIVNLALSLAQSGKRVILIDCDLRRPTIHRYFNLPNINGLSSWLEKKLSLVDVIQPATKYSFRVITSGQLPSDPTQILGKLDIKSLIDGLSSEFDYVLLDTPALLGVTDAVILAQSVDAILLIVSRTKSHRDSVQKTCNQLVEVNESIAVVVNRAEQNKKYSYYERNQVPSAKIPKDSDEKNSLKNLPR